MHRGYFAIWRKFEDHPFWKEKRVYSKAEAWIDLLWEAQHKLEPQEVVLGMKVLFCNYGESLKSLDTWSKRWGWNKSRVRRFLKLLEDMEQITTKNETKTTRITILNYGQYDPRRNGSETEVKRKRHASDTQATPDNNVKNDKNVRKKEKNKNIRGKVFSPPSLEMVLEYCQERKNSVDPERWFDHYTSNGWMVGKNKMKDWKAAVRTWERNPFYSQKKTEGPHNGFDQRDYQKGATKYEDIPDFLRD
jgi:hypothetical protein